MLHDPLTGLPGHALLLDRLDQALIRARTHGTLVSLVLVCLEESLFEAAGRLRRGLRADYTVGRLRDDMLAVVAEHPFGDGGPVAQRIRELLGPSVQLCWVTSDGDDQVDVMVQFVEIRLRKSG